MWRPRRSRSRSRLRHMTTSGPATRWITAGVDGTEHAVTEAAFDAGRQQAGEFEGVCGDEFLCAPMTVGPARRCLRCIRVLAALESLSNMDARLEPHRPSLLVRALRRCHKTPAGAGESRRPAPTGTHSGQHGKHAA